MNATELINFIEGNTEESFFTIQIFRLDSNLVKLIRRYIRNIYSMLYESDESNASAGMLRLELLKIQTSPTIPSSLILKNCKLDDAERVRQIWGADVANLSTQLNRAICLLNETGSPLLTNLVTYMSIEIKNHSVDQIKIWCHRKEVDSFLELFKMNDISLTNSNFICSLKEYRSTDIFEVLVRLGPMRSLGWSVTSKVILSAPRYRKLMQFVWDVTTNEEGFCHDPALAFGDYSKLFDWQEKTIVDDVQLADITDTDAGEAVDDFLYLTKRPININRDTKCLLIEFFDDIGVLLTPSSHQLLFSPHIDSEGFYYGAAQDIESPVYLLLYEVVADLGLNNPNENTGLLAVKWKAALSEMHQRNHQQLIEKMKISGIDLLGLDRAALNWMLTDGGVIHGPQKEKNFQILIEEVLPSCLGQNQWRKAWKEISNSRSQAQQDGRIESEIVNEQLLEALESETEKIQGLCEENGFFVYRINPDMGLSGSVKFYPVANVSSGFRSTKEKLGDIDSITNLEIFRDRI